MFVMLCGHRVSRESNLVKTLRVQIYDSLNTRLLNCIPGTTQIATMCDPRHKSLWFLSTAVQRTAWEKRFTAEVRRVGAVVFEKNLKKIDEEIKKQQEEVAALDEIDDQEAQPPECDSLLEDVINQQKKAKTRHAVPLHRPTQNEFDKQINEEIQKYLRFEPLLEMRSNGVYNSPFEWWYRQEQLNEYPIISLVARKYMCIPASEAPCERVFSLLGYVVDKIERD